MVDTVIIPVLKIAILLNAVLIAVTYMVLLERKVMAWVQSRLGPMRVGPYGALQPIADAVKLMIKEDITPVRADRWVFTAAPIIALVPALVVFAVIPFGSEINLFGRTIPLYITDINVGLLFLVSVTSIGVYGIILAGWASNSKYPLLASLRASAQLVSYEIAVTMTLVSLVITAGTLSMVGIVEAQRDFSFSLGPFELRGLWFVFAQPVAFVLVSDRRLGRNQPVAVRLARGGAGADRRLSYRVQRDAVCAVLPGRVRQRHRRLVCPDHPVFRRLAPALPECPVAGVPRHHARLDLVPREDLRFSVHLRVDPGDLASIPL